jgi:hypothetical protein
MTSITDYIVLSVAGLLYFIGEYKLAFWFSAFGIVNNAGAAIRVLVDPDWYFRKRLEANLPIDFFNTGIRRLLVIKVVMIAVLSWSAWDTGVRAGYF